MVAHLSFHHSASYDQLSIAIMRSNVSIGQARVTEIVASNHLATTILLEKWIMSTFQGRPIYD